MPFTYSDICPKCEQPHDLNPSWGGDVNIGHYTCPICGAEDAIEIEWETEYDMEPITEDDK